MDLDRLIDRFRGPLVGLIASFGAPYADATELAQDVFAEAYLSRERYRGAPDDEEQLGRWLRGIARNLFRDWRRGRERQRAVPLDDALGVAALPDLGTRDGAPQRDALGSALAALAPEQRTVLRMFYLEDASMRAISGLLGVSEKTVEGRLYRGRRELRRRLTNELSGGPQ